MISSPRKRRRLIYAGHQVDGGGVVLAVALALPAGPIVQAQNPAPWVAVAANETGRVGLAHGRPSREAATSTALSACGRDCRIEVAIQARCVSFASSTAAHAFGYSYGADFKTVEGAALRNCHSYAGSSTCKLYKTLRSP